jgi:short-subunit dehydrogenase
MGNKVVWITGASKGIGKSLAQIFSDNRFTTILSSRNELELKKITDSLNVINGNSTCLVCDVSDEKSVTEAFEEIKSKFGRIDILINNAGIGIFKEIINTSLDDFKKQIDTNLIGTFLCSKSVIPLMREQKSGQIINIISVAAVKAFLNSGSYGATKSAVYLLSKVLREEVKKYNIKVISVIPGATSTDIWNKKILEKYSDVMMKPDDVARVIFDVSNQPENLITEEILIRPITGDL